MAKPTPIDTDKFLASLNPDDPVMYARKWMTFTLKGYLAEATDEIVEAAFAAWDHYSLIPSVTVNREIHLTGLGVGNVIRQAISERPKQARALARRVVNYFSSPNIDVRVTAIVLFQDHPELFSIAEEGLAQMASSDSPHPIPEPGSNRFTLRAKAFQILYLNQVIYACDPQMKTARCEFATAMLSWARSPEEREEMEELLHDL